MTRNELSLRKKPLLVFMAQLHSSFVFCHDCEAVHDGKIKLDDCLSRLLFRSLTRNSRFSFQDYQLEVQKAHAGLGRIGSLLWRSLRSEKLEFISADVCVLEAWDPFVAGNERLVLRAQKWMILPFACADLGEVFGQAMRKHKLKEGNVLCRHLADKWDWEDLYEPQMAVQRCGECALEFKLEAKALGMIGWAVVVSSWRDMGRYVSVYDKRFKPHFECFERTEFDAQWDRKRAWRHQRDEEEGACWGESVDTSYDPLDGPRGWNEDEMSAASDLAVGGIKAMFEHGEECGGEMDEEGFVALLRKNARFIGKKRSNVDSPFVLMPRLERWGGWVKDGRDLYAGDIVDELQELADSGCEVARERIVGSLLRLRFKDRIRLRR